MKNDGEILKKSASFLKKKTDGDATFSKYDWNYHYWDVWLFETYLFSTHLQVVNEKWDFPQFHQLKQSA